MLRKFRPSRFARHERFCRICRHAQREAIEFEFIHWRSVVSLTRHYEIPNRASVYRHALAAGLFRQRLSNLRNPLDPLRSRLTRISLSGRRLSQFAPQPSFRAPDFRPSAASASREALALEILENLPATLKELDLPQLLENKDFLNVLIETKQQVNFSRFSSSESKSRRNDARNPARAEAVQYLKEVPRGGAP